MRVLVRLNLHAGGQNFEVGVGGWGSRVALAFYC